MMDCCHVTDQQHFFNTIPLRPLTNCNTMVMSITIKNSVEIILPHWGQDREKTLLLPVAVNGLY